MHDHSRLWFFLVMFFCIILVGAVGYYYLLDVSLVDALYMTIITISTVGYSEVAEMTTTAKFFSMFIIFWGVGTAGYTFTSLIVSIVEGGIADLWRNRKMDRKIRALENHYIICGGGETGEVIIEEFQKKNIDFVVIEHNEEAYVRHINNKVLCVFGDASEEETLEEANIKYAKGLISTLSKDVDNVFTVLTARQMNPHLYIISRAIDKSAPTKLKRAGANKTISANEIGGRRMASQMIRPSVIAFLDVITHMGDIEFDLEDVIINPESEMIHLSLRELKIPEKFGLIVLAIQDKKTKELYFNPKSDVIVMDGDTLIVLGDENQVNSLRRLARDNGERQLNHHYVKTL